MQILILSYPRPHCLLYQGPWRRESALPPRRVSSQSFGEVYSRSGRGLQVRGHEGAQRGGGVVEEDAGAVELGEQLGRLRAHVRGELAQQHGHLLQAAVARRLVEELPRRRQDALKRRAWGSVQA
eukprot:scaffold3980_cov61-Phaeocystis_antarctica.AAC.4